MNKATIHVNGLIGSWEEEKGLELTDVVSQVRAFGDFDELEIRIGSSPGGFVQDGLDIYNYIKSIKKPVTTVISGYCASVTSIIFLAGGTRLMRPGATLMIHNPWAEPRGDAHSLEQFAGELREIEKGFISVYDQVTGVGKEALSAMMREETEMTADEAVSLGFATGLAEDLKIAAYINNSKTHMTKKRSLTEVLSVLKALNTGGEPVGLTLQDAAGKEVVFNTENETPAVGDTATIDGAPADGEVVMPDGRTFVFAAGTLTEIREAEEEPGGEEMAEAIEEAVNAAIAPVVDAVTALAQLMQDQDTRLKTLASSVRSSFKPGQKDQNGLPKPGGVAADSLYEKVKKMKAEKKEGAK